MDIKKRNGDTVEYNPQKIADAIKKAFVATGTEFDWLEINQIVDKVPVHDGMTVEEIQDYVEKALMENYPDVAKAYIIYRFQQAGKRQMEEKMDFIKSYTLSDNAATASQYDPNANVEQKNIATLAAEVNKGDNIKLNRSIMMKQLTVMFGPEIANEYVRQLEAHEIYKHDETSIMPYCASVNMYQYLVNGLEGLGGRSSKPTNLRSFSGGFINLVFALAAQFAGAIATPEYLLYMDYFIRLEFGDDYFQRVGEVVYKSKKERTIEKVIEDHFQQVVYSLNQPAAARGYQSVFWNISYFDKEYFDAMFKDFRFPDENLTAPQWESVDWLQRKFMKWFNQERLRSVITFPVETMALLADGNGDYRDKEYADFTAEMYSEGHSFFTYVSPNADSLSSCCRLRNEIVDNQFSYSLGAGGIATGSKSVMTINLNRLIQNAHRRGIDYKEYLKEQVDKMHKYQLAYNEIINQYNDRGILTIYSAGFISPEKQYLTIGITGFIEGAEFLASEGVDISITPTDLGYQEYTKNILGTIMEMNKAAKTKTAMFNTEYIPGENVGPKMAKWDRNAGYFVPRESYNSYFYPVESLSLNVIDKFKLHGDEFVKYLDGGSALHCNLDEHLTKDQYRSLLNTASKEGTNYFTFNVPNSICNECGHIVKAKLTKCPKCGSESIDWITRIIGYLKRVSCFSAPRQVEASIRHYHKSITD